MSDRKETTRYLSKLIEQHINPHNDPRIYWAKEVTFDYTTSHTVRVDYMQFKPVNTSVSGIEKGDFYRNSPKCPLLQLWGCKANS